MSFLKSFKQKIENLVVWHVNSIVFYLDPLASTRKTAATIQKFQKHNFTFLIPIVNNIIVLLYGELYMFYSHAGYFDWNLWKTNPVVMTHQIFFPGTWFQIDTILAIATAASTAVMANISSKPFVDRYYQTSDKVLVIGKNSKQFFLKKMNIQFQHNCNFRTIFKRFRKHFVCTY